VLKQSDNTICIIAASLRTVFEEGSNTSKFQQNWFLSICLFLYDFILYDQQMIEMYFSWSENFCKSLHFAKYEYRSKNNCSTYLNLHNCICTSGRKESCMNTHVCVRARARVCVCVCVCVYVCVCACVCVCVCIRSYVFFLLYLFLSIDTIEKK